MKGLKRVLRAGLTALAVLFAIFCAAMLIFTMVSRARGGRVKLFGYELMLVQTGSMAGEAQPYDIPTLPAGSLIAVKTVGEGFYEGLKVGDVITFWWQEDPDFDSTRRIVTHRLREIREEGGVWYLTTHGDANGEASVEETSSADGAVIGRVTGVSPGLGRAVAFLQSKNGLLAVIIVPCALLILLEIMRIVSAVSRARAEKAGDTQNAAIQSQLEALQRQLDQLNRRQDDDKGGRK